MSETETISLNLGGNFAEGASESIAAADGLASAIGKLDAASERVKDPKFIRADKISAVAAAMNQQASVAGRIAGFDAGRVRDLDRQEKLLRKMHDDALGITAEKAKQAQSDRRSEDLSVGASALAGAGAVVLSAAAAIGAAAWKLEQAGVATTSRHEVQGGVGKALGGDYEQSITFALRAGIDPEKTWEQTKRLLGDKFSQHQGEEIVKVSAGMDLAGQNGEGYVSALARIKLEAKTSSRDIDGLRKVGIDAKDVYAELARTMGTDVATASAKVKRGLADSGQVLDAIQKVAGAKYGSIANVLADSVPALVSRVQGDIGEMFNFGPGALDGVKDVLRNVTDVLEGPTGKEIGAAAKEVFDELNHAFLDDFRGDEGRKKIEDFAHNVAGSIHEIAVAVHEVAPLIKLVEDMGLEAAKPKGQKMGVGDIAAGKEGSGAAASNMVAGSAWDAAKGITGAGAIGMAWDVGSKIVGGIIDGIRGGTGGAAAAGEEAANAAIAGAKHGAVIRSPSHKAADEVGAPIAEGLAVGMTRSSSPADAGRRMAQDAIAGAKGGAAGASGGGMISGAPPSSFHEGDVTIVIQGATAENAKQWQGDMDAFMKQRRRESRDRHEGARG